MEKGTFFLKNNNRESLFYGSHFTSLHLTFIVVIGIAPLRWVGRPERTVANQLGTDA